jgi:hypothetical protein
VVARHRHVVEEDVAVRAAADRQALALERERLADTAPAGADDERGAARGDLVEVDRDDLTRLPTRYVAVVLELGASRLPQLGANFAVGPSLERRSSGSARATRRATRASSSPDRPARMSVRRCTSAPVMTSSPPRASCAGG